MKNRRYVLDRLTRKPRLYHRVINPLNVGTFDRLQLHSPDCRGNMVFDDALIALESQQLYLVYIKGGEPFVEPLRYSNLARFLIGTLVQFSKDCRHLLACLLLGIRVYAAPDGLACAGVRADGDTRLPLSI